MSSGAADAALSHRFDPNTGERILRPLERVAIKENPR